MTYAAGDLWCLVIGLLPFWVPCLVWFVLRPLLKWHDRRRDMTGRGFEVNTTIAGETPVQQRKENDHG